MGATLGRPMGTFFVHESHRVELLAGELGTLFEAPHGAPFDPEAIVVPGRGMGVWLSMQLARKLGVWATPFSYPRALVERVVRATLGDDALGPEPLSEDLVEWCVRETLPSLLGDPDFEKLARYLEGDEHGERLSELAARIAQVFDQYLTYRPAWIRAWEAGGVGIVPEGERWQPRLWQRVQKRLAARHVAHVEEELLARLSGARAVWGLPPRVSLFGFSTLPPLYLRVFVALSRRVDVHLFRFAPGRAPTGEARAPGGLAGIAGVGPLLGLGATGDELSEVLEATLAAQGVRAERRQTFERRPVASLLEALTARLGGDAAIDPATFPLDGDERASVAVHSCHGPMREVEVLHDQLLALLTRTDDPVAPDDVAVLVPDLAAYAPLVEAVFRREPGDLRFIPFRVADLGTRARSPGLDALLRVLAMVRGRVTAAEVTDLLGLDIVRTRLGLDAPAADRIGAWIVESGIRWGLDDAHLTARGLPAADALTWEFGLRRLLVGYALPSGGVRSFHGVFGYDEVEGKEAALLGILAHFVRSLGRHLRDCERPRSLSDWALALADLAAELFGEDPEGLRERASIELAVADLVRVASAAGFNAALDVRVVARLLERRADARGAESGFLAGGVTFSAMVPMRSIPFRVVVLLGMNDGAFPRSPRPLEFDLMANGAFAREVGDRVPRDDDRQLFLETLFAARERLIVTTSGRSVKDDRVMPPSACLGELVEALAGPAGTDGAKERRSALVTDHPLQAFSPAYFDGTEPRLFSYRSEYETSAQSLSGPAQPDRPFVTELEAFARPRELALDELIRFWKSPPTYLLNRRLGIYLKERRPERRPREPLEPDDLERWHIASALLEALIAEPDPELAVPAVEERLRGRAALAVGGWGGAQLSDLREVCQQIAEKVRSLRGDEVEGREAVAIALAGGTKIAGSVPSVFGGRLIEHGYSTLDTRRELELWIRHLALCAAEGAPRQSSVRVGRDGKKSGTIGVLELVALPRARAIEHLELLVERYLEGQARPLPFLPPESDAYVGKVRAGKANEGIGAAQQKYEGQGGTLQRDPHPQRAFNHRLPPFNPLFDRGERSAEQTRFHALALEVLGPCHDARAEAGS